MLILFALNAAAMLIVGIYGFLAASKSIINEVSFGLLMLAIGYMRLMKTAMEMFGNFRSDKRVSHIE
jgi:hypothetical protein